MDFRFLCVLDKVFCVNMQCEAPFERLHKILFSIILITVLH